MNSIIEMLAWRAKERGDKTCIIDSEGKTTYSELFQMALKVAGKLRESGIGKNDCVVLQVEQKACFMAKVLAIHLLGGRSVPVEKNCPEERAVELIQTVGAKVYFFSQKLDVEAYWIYNGTSFEEQRTDYDFSFPEPEMIADIIFTTGTTGKSKGVMISHRAIMATVENLQNLVGIREEEIALVPTPLNHAHALRRTYVTILNGHTTVLMDGVANLKQFFLNLQEEHVTGMYLMSAMLSYILKVSGDKLGEYRDLIHFVELGSSPLGEEERKQLMSLLPDSELIFDYGATESGCTCGYDMNEHGNIPFCVGKPNINANFSFADEEGNVIQATCDNPGLIVTQGPMNMSGYFDEPDLTGKVLKEGKIFSNDWGYMDENQFVYFLGRKGDVINMGGIKISALEIEKAALLWDEVTECACVPKPDANFGEIPVLFVAVKDKHTFDKGNLETFLKEKLELSRVPKEIRILDGLPKTFNGKIIKKGLIEK